MHVDHEQVWRRPARQRHCLVSPAGNADLVAKIFEPYEQAHRGRGGSGVGLTVVRFLVEAHGGHVWVESEEGRGSRFTFTLPVSAPAVRSSLA